MLSDITPISIKSWPFMEIWFQLEIQKCAGIQSITVERSENLSKISMTQD